MLQFRGVLLPGWPGEAREGGGRQPRQRVRGAVHQGARGPGARDIGGHGRMTRINKQK